MLCNLNIPEAIVHVTEELPLGQGGEEADGLLPGHHWGQSGQSWGAINALWLISDEKLCFYYFMVGIRILLVCVVFTDIDQDWNRPEDVPVKGEPLYVHKVAPVGVNVPVAVFPGLLILNLGTERG